MRKTPDLPFYIFAATADDEFRKPKAGMWSALKEHLARRGVDIGVCSSYYLLTARFILA
jgi:hypothetical protein